MTVVKSAYERQKHDLYETEEWATRALLSVILDEQGYKPKCIWEPACGNFKMANVLREVAPVYTSDIIQHGEQKPDFLYDFLSDYRVFFENRPDWVITNPPYGKGNRDAVTFARKALERVDYVALLLTAKFDFGSTRKDLFGNSERFIGKVTLTDRLSFFNGKTGTEDHAWYIWAKTRWVKPRLWYRGKNEVYA